MPITSGSIPPLVTQSTTVSAPASQAVRSTDRAYSVSSEYPSKKCSASKITRLPALFKNATESRIMERFSSFVVRSTRST